MAVEPEHVSKVSGWAQPLVNKFMGAGQNNFTSRETLEGHDTPLGSFDHRYVIQYI